MHDKFEKEVQKKMEELRLTPSAPVWEKIELEIQPEKKRRRVFLWLFFGLLLAGGGLVAYQLTATKDPIAQEVSIPTSPESASIIEKEKLTEQPHSSQVEKVIDKSTDVLTGSIAEKSQEIFQQQKKANYPSQAKKKIERSSGIINKAIAAKEKTVPYDRYITPGNDKEHEEVIMKQRESSAPAIIQNEIATPTDHAKTAEKLKQTDSLAKQPEEKVEIQKAVDSSLKRKVAAKKGWQKQILVSGGMSGYRSVTSPTIAMVAGNVMASPGTAAPVFYRPAETSGGLAFAVGFSFAKKINEHFELAFGLQYAHYSTRTKVGNSRQNDTTLLYASNAYRVDAFYTNTSSGYHNNRFHVAEIPVTISYKPSLKLPLYFSVGAAYGRLVATNALTFSNRNNVYFQNKEDYVKNMLPVSSSVQVELFRKKKVSLRVGPVVQYNLLKLQKEATEGERHLFFAGIKSAVIF